ncbi:MAG: nucleoside-diphosphate sugar epimerase/dehydratase [Formivibrio sp.]|nr:nucleoside-diphosphate sugar epimerase/dehydratase [Formivibrio sp.]
MIKRFSSLPRQAKSLIMVAADTIFLPVSFWLALGIRLDVWHFPVNGIVWWVYFLPVPISLPVFLKMGLYRSVIRYIEERAILTMLQAVSLSVVLFSSAVHFINVSAIPRGALLVFWLLAGVYICASRFFSRYLLRVRLVGNEHKSNVVIYGAGSAGLQLASALRAGCEYQPVGFIDDDSALQGLMMAGLKVFGPVDLPKLVASRDIGQVLLALPSASRSRRVEIVNQLEPLKVEVKELPGMTELVNGAVTVSDIREVGVDELLGRDSVPPDQMLLAANNNGKVVMVTGAGGSIGSELCRQILTCQPTCLVLYELSEFALYSIERELAAFIRKSHQTINLIPVLGSVRDGNRLSAIMRRYAVHTVYHAAAYKHVPLVEFNVTEGVLNNTFGTLAVAEAAVAARVETFVLISTDKAVRPTNVMGATKRMAELVLQSFALDLSCKTRFCMVRFGNVLGSSGSVVPLFRRQIAAGGPVTVTHPEIIRYFMTIPEAAQLVIQAGAMGGNGEVFVLDMGKPIKIMDLAKRMIHLSGRSVRDEQHPDGDIEIKYTGLRPGEKLYEELLIGDAVAGTNHPRILKAQEYALTKTDLEPVLQKLNQACRDNDCPTIINILCENVHGFKPENEIRDHLTVA